MKSKPWQMAYVESLLDLESANEAESLVSQVAQRRESYGSRSFESIRSVAHSIGLNRIAPKQIIVAGTNGKGTTVSYLQQLYNKLGYRVGTTTSPHLHCYLERIAIDGLPIEEEECLGSIRFVDSQIPNLRLTYFDVTTLAALHYFQIHSVDVVIAEVGLGGRLDTVNTLEPDISILTNVGLDHQELLGESIAEITREKLGIARRGTPLLFGGASDNHHVDQIANQLGAELFRVGRDFGVSEDGRRMFFSGGWDQRLQSKHGRSLALNSLSLAIQACVLLESPIQLSSIDLDELYQPAGRWEHLRIRDVDWVLDIAHNPDGISFMRKRLHAMGITKFVGVFGCMANKDAEGMTKALMCSSAGEREAEIDSLVLASTSGERGQSAQTLVQCIDRWFRGKYSFASVPSSALNEAMQVSNGLPIVVFGSVDLVAKARVWLHEQMSVRTAA